MFFSKTLVLAFAVSALAAPATHKHVKRAGVLSVSDYSDFQISDGVAGNALEEVAQKFPIDTNDLANVDSDDLDILKAARETAEAAETDDGGFNDAIEQAGEDSDAGKALQVGKIKNKVLKLQLEVLALQIEAAQGGDDNSDKIAEEQKKLDTNVATDKESAGQTSQPVDFDGDDSP